MDQSVIEKWWEQLGMTERVALLFYSNMEELKVAARVAAEVSYPSLNRQIQEVIESGFLVGREGNGFWFGISWTSDCPLCEQQSNEKGSILFRSEDFEELRAYLAQQGAACMNCGKASPKVTVQLQALKAPLVVLRELAYTPPVIDGPSTGTYYFDAWAKDREQEFASLQTSEKDHRDRQ